jgi:hypothetical protein
MAAVVKSLEKNGGATYKVVFKHEGLGVERVTAYWKVDRGRLDTKGPEQDTRHYATDKGLIECVAFKDKDGYDCYYKDTPLGYSFRLNAGPDWRKQAGYARTAGARPVTRKILGQTVDCWSYDQTQNDLEAETCVNEDGAVLSYRGGKRGEGYSAVAVSYTTEVSDAELKAPEARRIPTPFFPRATTTTIPTSTTVTRPA